MLHSKNEIKLHYITKTSKENYTDLKKILFNMINGDAFYPISALLEEYRRMFFFKLLSDATAFKLILFLMGKFLKIH